MKSRYTVHQLHFILDFGQIIWCHHFMTHQWFIFYRLIPDLKDSLFDFWTYWWWLITILSNAAFEIILFKFQGEDYLLRSGMVVDTALYHLLERVWSFLLPRKSKFKKNYKRLLKDLDLAKKINEPEGARSRAWSNFSFSCEAHLRKLVEEKTCFVPSELVWKRSRVVTRPKPG